MHPPLEGFFGDKTFSLKLVLFDIMLRYLLSGMIIFFI